MIYDQGELQLPLASPRPADSSGSGCYQIAAFVLGLGVYEILHAPFKTEVSISPSPLELLNLSPDGFQR